MSQKIQYSLVSLSVRYFLIFLLAFPNLFLFYALFTPLTVYPSYALISMLIPTYLDTTTLYTPLGAIILSEACIAGAAYYLLFVLNLATPMPLKKRMPALLFSFLAFLILNILRILLFSFLFFIGFPFFSTTHLVTWYGASTLLLVAIWLAEIRLFHIKEIPVYSDARFLLGR